MSLLTQNNGGSLQLTTLSTINALAASVFPSQGNIFWVATLSGSDVSNDGTVQRPFKTLAHALSQCTANQNDVVYLLAQSNTAAQTTDYQNVTLNWNKDGVHLIGVNSNPFLGQRSRVALDSAYATASDLFKLSANGCFISGIEFFEGVASVLPTGCMQVTGQRNRISNCQISGMGNSANDISGAYSLYLNGAQENIFENCYIGLDTVTLGAQANSQIKCASAATRNIFRKCQITTYTNHATNNNFLRAPTGSLDRWLQFDDCRFVNPIDASSTNLTQAFIVASDAGGTVLLTGGDTGVLGATDWNSTDSANVTAINGTVTAATFGLAVDVTR